MVRASTARRTCCAAAAATRRRRSTSPWPSPVPVLACGAELKSTIALARDRHVFLSHHIGDLKNYDAYRVVRRGDRARRAAVRDHARARRPRPPPGLRVDGARPRAGRVARRRRPSACSTTTATSPRASPTAGVDGPVIGVAFDGTGYGPDGTVWGGEFLVADLLGFERVGWLAPVPLPGGDAAAHEPWRMAASYLDVLGEADDAPAALAAGVRWADVRGDGPGRRQRPADVVGRAAVRRRRRARSASAARAPTRGRRRSSWRRIVDPAEHGAYPMAHRRVARSSVPTSSPPRWPTTAPAWRRAVDRRPLPPRAGRRRGGDGAAGSRRRPACATVALSGGVFANVVLLRSAHARADGRRASACCATGGSRATTAASASARPSSPRPATAPAGDQADAAPHHLVVERDRRLLDAVHRRRRARRSRRRARRAPCPAVVAGEADRASPRRRASASPASTFGDVPLVDRATTASPGRASVASWRANTTSKLTSLASAVTVATSSPSAQPLAPSA